MKRSPEQMDALRDRILLGKPDLDAVDLMGCPLCGGASELRMMLRKFYGACTECGCSGPLKDTIEAAQQAWEQRHE